MAVAGFGWVVIACEGKVAEALRGWMCSWWRSLWLRRRCGIGLRRLARGEVDDVAVVDANYLRRTDFEIKAKLALRAAELGGGTAG